MSDPSLEVCPDFNSDGFRTIREFMIAGSHETNQQTVERLIISWTEDHNRRIGLWQDQQAVEAEAAEQVQRARREQEEEAQRLAEEEVERERREADKKKAKLNDFDDTLTVDNKLSSFEYVPLWYFSPEGCRDAAKNSIISADDAFGFTKVDDVLTVRPVAAVKASRNAIEDHELNITDFLRAKNSYLHHLDKAGWTQRHTDSLAQFFWHLENHPFRDGPNGNIIIMTYAHRVRRNWHDNLKLGKGFNIAIINESLMNTIAFEVNTSAQQNTLRKATTH
ncbi:hypothetical protein BU15DRAFT_64919 [Melanogaster broomeanus]|nr:hypothetical protein BU15DRAFT_64919 [Melanogaster broomeanus]